MKKVLLVDDENRSEANFTFMKKLGINVAWEQNCENVLNIDLSEFSVIILDVMMKSSDKSHVINCHKDIPNINGHNSGIILLKLLNEKLGNQDDLKIFFLSARKKIEIDKYCEEKEYYRYYEKGVDNKIEMFEEIKKLTDE